MLHSYNKCKGRNYNVVILSLIIPIGKPFLANQILE